MKKDKGFSLVELIVVIAIMAVLMGILIPTIISNVSKSKRSVDVNSADEIIHAIERVLTIDTDLYDEITSGNYSTYKITWNKNSKESDFVTDKLAKQVFDDLGSLPVSKYDSGLTWIVKYNSSNNKIYIYLADNASSTTGYELYPESDLYIKKHKKTSIISD